MAANSIHHIHYPHHYHCRDRRLPPPLDPPPTPPPSLFLKPRPRTSVRYSTTSFSVSPATSSAATSSSALEDSATSYDALRESLASGDFLKADEETRRLVIALAGEPALKRGYVFFSEVQFIPEADLRAIDELWREHSGGRFGYSIQKKVWEKANRDFTVFFVRVGWMKKLDTEVEQYNYRSFPGEFTWELDDATPLGHLPLTNALRGTQLLNCILTHPAFEEVDGRPGEEAKEDVGMGTEVLKGLKDGSSASTALKNDRAFKTDYTF